MGRKSKASSLLPTLFKRGKKGFYYFRRYVEGKDKWICTLTSDQKEAVKFSSDYINAEIVTRAEAKRNTAAHKLGNSFVEAFTNRPQILTSLADVHQIWIDHFPGYNDVSVRSRKNYNTIFNAFTTWCKDNKIEYIEAVDNSLAVRYSKYLWDSGYTGSTYNAHIM